MSKRYVVCAAGHRNDRAGGRRKCAEPECGLPLRKPPTRKHREILRHGYAPFVEAAERIHGVSDESCCACGKPRPQEGHHHRDHDHNTGRARGLLCGGSRGCNLLLVRWVTAATARGIATAKRAANEPDAERWDGLAAYLERVEAFYRDA